jgi:hypothetical protein
VSEKLDIESECLPIRFNEKAENNYQQFGIGHKLSAGHAVKTAGDL